jgi:hypothetical protein
MFKFVGKEDFSKWFFCEENTLYKSIWKASFLDVWLLYNSKPETPPESVMKPKKRSLTKARSSCKSCKLLHDKHRIVCAVHPYGPETSDCPDREPVSRWIYWWRGAERLRGLAGIFLQGMLDAFKMLSLLFVAAIIICLILYAVFRFDTDLPRFIKIVCDLNKLFVIILHYSAVALFAGTGILCFLLRTPNSTNGTKLFIRLSSIIAASFLWPSIINLATFSH